jgi:hypothetical protein
MDHAGFGDQSRSRMLALCQPLQAYLTNLRFQRLGPLEELGL